MSRLRFTEDEVDAKRGTLELLEGGTKVRLWPKGDGKDRVEMIAGCGAVILGVLPNDGGTDDAAVVLTVEELERLCAEARRLAERRKPVSRSVQKYNGLIAAVQGRCAPNDELLARALAAAPSLVPRDAAMLAMATACASGFQTGTAEERAALACIEALCAKAEGGSDG
jgi:hypothetical protein